jgi:AraC-like DNA-binding protein
MKEPVVCFEKDAFIRNYLHSLRLMLASENNIPPALLLLKFEELMLWLAEKYPESLLSFQTGSPADDSDQQLINTVESNLHNHISVEDLAFLCNTSLSTFKRKFARLYGGISPNKWILQKRMELAAELLQHHHEKPSEVYYKVGYENHSSFTHSFKQVFGQTPREFQQEKISYPATQAKPKLDVYQ